MGWLRAWRFAVMIITYLETVIMGQGNRKFDDECAECHATLHALRVQDVIADILNMRNQKTRDFNHQYKQARTNV